VGRIIVVGAGPGSPEYVTLAAKRAVRQADVVVGSERALRLFRNNMRGEALPLTAHNFKQTLEQAVKKAEQGKSVAVVSTGDPGFAGLLRPVLEVVGERNVEVKVVPGVSAIQACAARALVSWENTVLLSFHDGVSEAGKKQLLTAVRAGKQVMLLPDPKAFTLKEIAKFLTGEGVNKNTEVVLCEDLTLKTERLIETTLEEARAHDSGRLTVILIKAEQKTWPKSLRCQNVEA